MADVAAFVQAASLRYVKLVPSIGSGLQAREIPSFAFKPKEYVLLYGPFSSGNTFLV
jgi:hypothetical protein